MSKDDGINKALLQKIVSGEVKFISQADGLPMLNHKPQLIEVNTASLDPNDNTRAECRATADAAAYLAAAPALAGVPSNGAAPSKYKIMTGIALPEAKRRGNVAGIGGPSKYPFDQLDVGGVFFSGNSEHKKGDAVKGLGSTVSAHNNKYSEPVMENGVAKTKTVTRAVRDKKTHKAILNTDGTKQTETVQLPVKNYTRKFTIRPVKAGYQSGDWTAPEDGALVGRIK